MRKRKSLVKMFEDFIEKPPVRDTRERAAGEAVEDRQEKNQQELERIKRQRERVFGPHRD